PRSPGGHQPWPETFIRPAGAGVLAEGLVRGRRRARRARRRPGGAAVITRTAEEIAGILRCSPRTVTRKVRAGEWPGRLIAGRYVFTAEDLAEILERCRAKPATPPAAEDRPV